MDNPDAQGTPLVKPRQNYMDSAKEYVQNKYEEYSGKYEDAHDKYENMKSYPRRTIDKYTPNRAKEMYSNAKQNLNNAGYGKVYQNVKEDTGYLGQQVKQSVRNFGLTPEQVASKNKHEDSYENEKYKDKQKIYNEVVRDLKQREKYASTEQEASVWRNTRTNMLSSKPIPYHNERAEAFGQNSPVVNWFKEPSRVKVVSGNKQKQNNVFNNTNNVTIKSKKKSVKVEQPKTIFGNKQIRPISLTSSPNKNKTQPLSIFGNNTMKSITLNKKSKVSTPSKRGFLGVTNVVPLSPQKIANPFGKSTFASPFGGKKKKSGLLL